MLSSAVGCLQAFGCPNIAMVRGSRGSKYKWDYRGGSRGGSSGGSRSYSSTPADPWQNLRPLYCRICQELGPQMSLVTRIVVDRDNAGGAIPGEHAGSGHHGERVASRHRGERKQASWDLDFPKTCRRELCAFAFRCGCIVRAR